LSFGFEFDAAEVDKIVEQQLHCDPVPQSPLKSLNDAFKGNVTPKLAGQVFTPLSTTNRKSRSATNKFGRTRERISTPIEDSENMALFSSAHSPVFSPVTGAFPQFENSAVRSQARRRSFENPSGHPNKWYNYIINCNAKNNNDDDNMLHCVQLQTSCGDTLSLQ